MALRILRSGYRKLVWVGLEPTTTEFYSDALTNWAIKPWVQLALRASFVQLFQFYLFVQCSRIISAIAFVSRHICFKQNLSLSLSLSLYIYIFIYIYKKWIRTITSAYSCSTVRHIKQPQSISLKFFMLFLNYVVVSEFYVTT